MFTDKQFGAYDCMLNCFAHTIKQLAGNNENLYFYNWDIWVNTDKLFFGGSIRENELLDYTRKICNIDIIADQDFDKLTSIFDVAFVIIDAYSIPIIKQFYQQVHQDHYVIITPYGSKFKLVDPLHGWEGLLDYHQLQSSWNYYKGNIILINKDIHHLNQITSVDSKKTIAPYLSSLNYIEIYSIVEKELCSIFANHISDIQKNKQLFERFFSMFRTISIARQNHFSVSGNEYYGKQIKSAWTTVLKTLTILSVNSAEDISNLRKTINYAFQCEIHYLTNNFSQH